MITSKYLLLVVAAALVRGGAARKYSNNNNHHKNNDSNKHERNNHKAGNKNQVTEFDDGRHPAVSKIHLRWGKELDSITVTYKLANGTSVEGEPRGGKGGQYNKTFDLEEDEGIIAVVGLRHLDDSKHGMQELIFKTDKNRILSIYTDGRFEDEPGEAFTYRAPRGHILGGVKGKAGKFVNEIDVHWVKHTDHMDMIDVPNSDFQIKKKLLSWDEHVDEAKRLGYTLAEIADKEQHKKVAVFLKGDESFSEHGYWLGGKRVKGMVFEWLNGERATYTHWHRFEPSNTNGNQNCIEIMKKNDKWGWNDEECSVKKYALYELIEVFSYNQSAVDVMATS